MLEALAMGKPAIVSDMPGCAEPVENAKAGWVIPAGDIGALTRAMEEAVELSPIVLRDMGLRGRAEIIRRYSTEVVTSETLLMYDRIKGV